MNTYLSRRMLPALAGVLFSLSVLVCGVMGAVPADAAGPATVTVRVIGSNDQPLLPLTQVTTTTTPVVKDGKPEDSCTGTSAAGALELATKGNWDGEWNSSFGYGVETIEGASYPFTQPDFWTFWLDNKESSEGVCGKKSELNSGDSVLFFVSCYSETSGVCPASPNVLAIQASPTAEVGKSMAVTVLSYPNAGGEPVPAVGAIVEGGGVSSSPTNAQGQTTLTFSADGSYTIDATGSAGESSAIRGEAFVCAHTGNDGTCGTIKASAGNTGTISKGISTTPIVSTVSPAAIVAKVAGVKNGHVYRRRAAPRLLKGSVAVPAGGLLRKVEISLKRRYRGRCYAFDGSAARFVAIKCKQAASFFSVGTNASFSYLLPARLPKGSYTYDIEAVNVAGQATKLVNGISHVVFQVK
jgi:hypothetical protein